MKTNSYYEGQIIWAQIDANRHMRHSAYADLCAQARSNMLKSVGFSLEKFAEIQIGPILFREELIYHKEVHLDENVYVTVELSKYDTSNSRFSFRHTVCKEDGTKCCTVNVDGAWLDLNKRKLTALPEEFQAYIDLIPKSEDF